MASRPARQSWLLPQPCPLCALFTAWALSLPGSRTRHLLPAQTRDHQEMELHANYHHGMQNSLTEKAAMHFSV